MGPNDNNETPEQQPAAQPSATAQPAATQQPATQPAAASAPTPTSAQPAAQAVAAPTIVQPKKRGGLAGIVDELRDALAGPAPGKIYTDPQGNEYIQHPDSAGQKWIRIAQHAANMVRGGLAGMGQTGPGANGRAIQVGAQIGEQAAGARRDQEVDLQNEVQQNNLEKYNAIKQQHDLAQQNFEMTRRGIAADRADMEFHQGQLAQELKPKEQGGYGSIDLGTAKDYADFATQMQAKRPDFWKQVYADDGHNIKQYPEFDENGKQTGIHVVMRTEDIAKQAAPEGATFKRFVPGEKPGELGHLEDATPSGQQTVGQLQTWTNAALKQQNDEKIAAANLADKTADAHKKDADAEAKLHPQPKAGRGGKGTNVPAPTGDKPDDENLIRMVGTGQMEIGNWGYLLSRMKDPSFARAVAKQYPDMDTTTIARYMKASDEFASSKTGAGKQLNNGSTAINHLGELYDAASASSMIPYTEDNNKTTTLKAGIIGELGQFYGESTIPGQSRFEKGIGSAVPSARKDAILEQIKMLGDKMSSFQQQWKNSMPSAHFTRPMPGLSPEAMRTWATLDPVGAKIFQAHQDAMDMNKNGAAQHAAPQQSGMVNVQIPGHPPGQIPTAALEKFKQDNPTAQVLQ